MTATADQVRLPLGLYRLRFEALGEIRLPAYAGSAWRGALGHALKRATCVVRGTACDGCLLRGECVYSYLFETPPPPTSDKLRRYTAAPHPFVLIPEERPAGAVAAGATLTLGLTLLGRANRHLPYLLHAFRLAGEEGLGGPTGPTGPAGPSGKGKRGRFRLAAAEARPHPGAPWQPLFDGERLLAPVAPAIPAPPPPPAGDLLLRLHTPLRLKRDGDLVTPAAFRFHDLYRNLLRRLSLLSHFHGDAPLALDFAALSQACRTVELTAAALHWHDWGRYSARQDEVLRMGGLVGEVTLTAEAAAPYWPHLWLGQWTHAGKGTSMGLGRYEIVAGEGGADRAEAART